MARLFELFGETTLSGRDLLTSPPSNMANMAVSGVVSSTGVMKMLEIVNRVTPKIDYSDFSKFVFFNSALDYFNISGDRMIAEYPYDGNYDDFLAFRSSSDPFQNYLIDAWPHWSGAGYFSGSNSAYVITSDTSNANGYPAMLALSTGTSGTFNVPITIEYRMLFTDHSLFPNTGTGAIVLQHIPATSITPNFSDPNFSIFVSTGTINFYLSGATFTPTSVAAQTSSDSIATFGIGNAAPSGSGYFMAWVLDPQSGTLHLHHTPPGSNEYPFMDTPQLAATWNFVTSSRFDSGSSVFVVGRHTSGVLPSPFTVANPDFQISELRYWTMARDHEDIYKTYNQRVYKDEPLALYWRFAEPYTRPGANNSGYYFVRDYSGNKIDGAVYNASATFWVPSSAHAGGFGMSPQDRGEPILSPRCQYVIDYVRRVQATASLYDRNNANLITNLVPQQYLHLEDERNTSVMKNLLYLLGRQFDELKVSIDQMTRLLVADYSETNATPDALLDDVLRFWGWSTKGNFLSKEAFQWFFGLNVLDRTQADIDQGVYSNERLDVLLYEIKNEFWRRTLNNLAYLYKTKGTKESVEALFRIYGLDSSVVKLKEYGLKPFVKIETNRINSTKSHTVLRVNGDLGSYGVATDGQKINVPDSTFTVAAQIAFPAFGSRLMDQNILTGSIFHIDQSQGGESGRLAQPLSFPMGDTGITFGSQYEHLYYIRELRSGTLTNVGNLVYRAYDNSFVTFSDLPIFDGRWYNISVERSGTNVRLDIQFLDTDRLGRKPSDASPVSIALPATLSGTLGAAITSPYIGLTVGFTPDLAIDPGQFWIHNVMLWSQQLTDVERQDHTLNPFSQGSDTPERYNQLRLNWQFDNLVDSDNNKYFDSSQYNSHGYLIGLAPYTGSWETSVYDRFNFPYNFIAPPDYNWTEEKIRYVDNPRPDPRDHWSEINDVGIEFNLIDALNEDISYMMSTMDNWNNVIGDPANKYRESYPVLEKLRQQYFTRLTGRINFRVFIDFLDFFDRSFIELVKRLLPARIDFQGAEVVVESHMLERPKVQWNYRRQNPQLVPEGTILIYGHPALELSYRPAIVVSPSAPIYIGQSATLTWAASNADSIYINQGIGLVTGSSYTVSPLSTTTYVITASGSGGSASGSVTVAVYAYSLPTVALTASPTTINYGESSLLTWTYTSATLLTIDNGVGVVVGSNQSVTPLLPTTYTITASGSGGEATASAAVDVIPALVSIAVNPVNISADYPATGTIQYEAIGTYTDATTQDLTTQVTWSSSDETTATIVSNTGLVTINAPIPPTPPLSSPPISMLTIAAPTNYRDNPTLANLEPFPFRSSSAAGSAAGGDPPTGWHAFGYNESTKRHSISWFTTPFDACGKYVLDQTSSLGNWIVDGNGIGGTAHYGASTYPETTSLTNPLGGWRHFTPDTNYTIAPGLGNYGGVVSTTSLSWIRIAGYNYTFQSLIVDHTGTKYGKACSGGSPLNAAEPRIAHFVGHENHDTLTLWDKDFTTVTAVKLYNSSDVFVADMAFKSKGIEGMIVWLDPAIHAGTNVYVIFESPTGNFRSPAFDIHGP